MTQLAIPTEAEIAWLAGIYEGEGSLILNKRACGSCVLSIQRRG